MLKKASAVCLAELVDLAAQFSSARFQAAMNITKDKALSAEFARRINFLSGTAMVSRIAQMTAVHQQFSGRCKKGLRRRALHATANSAESSLENQS